MLIRLIKRYGSRKLYDTEESRYVSLEEIAGFVRAGQQVRVVDNATDEEVTAPTLTQIILEEGRSGRRALPSALLHELVRLGGRRLRRGVDQVQGGASALLQAALERLTPVREARSELDLLRRQLAQLEGILGRIESADVEADSSGGRASASPASRAPVPRRPAPRRAAQRRPAGGAKRA